MLTADAQQQLDYPPRPHEDAAAVIDVRFLAGETELLSAVPQRRLGCVDGGGLGVNGAAGEGGAQPQPDGQQQQAAGSRSAARHAAGTMLVRAPPRAMPGSGRGEAPRRCRRHQRGARSSRRWHPDRHTLLQPAGPERQRAARQPPHGAAENVPVMVLDLWIYS